MGFKPTCCFACSIFSLIGTIFYLSCAAMVYRRNWVFISHKAGMSMFTSTDEQLEEKMI